jgi:hypothetical protein
MQDRADDIHNPGYAARTSRMPGREEVAGVTDWARTGWGGSERRYTFGSDWGRMFGRTPLR